jgi:hypothetical protein
MDATPQAQYGGRDLAVLTLVLVLGVWVIAVNAHVLKHALESSMGFCVLLVLLQIVTQIVLIAVLPIPR